MDRGTPYHYIYACDHCVVVAVFINSIPKGFYKSCQTIKIKDEYNR